MTLSFVVAFGCAGKPSFSAWIPSNSLTGVGLELKNCDWCDASTECVLTAPVDRLCRWTETTRFTAAMPTLLGAVSRLQVAEVRTHIVLIMGRAEGLLGIVFD